MKSKYNFIQLYNVWVNGRDICDVDQHFPVITNVDRNWHSNFKLAVKDFFTAKVFNDGDKFGCYDEIYQDYIVTLYVIDLDIDKFKLMYNIKFDLNNDTVQELIPYYCDYDFSLVAERISKFR